MNTYINLLYYIIYGFIPKYLRNLYILKHLECIQDQMSR